MLYECRAVRASHMHGRLPDARVRKERVAAASISPQTSADTLPPASDIDPHIAETRAAMLHAEPAERSDIFERAAYALTKNCGYTETGPGIDKRKAARSLIELTRLGRLLPPDQRVQNAILLDLSCTKLLRFIGEGYRADGDRLSFSGYQESEARAAVGAFAEHGLSALVAKFGSKDVVENLDVFLQMGSALSWPVRGRYLGRLINEVDARVAQHSKFQCLLAIENDITKLPPEVAMPLREVMRAAMRGAQWTQNGESRRSAERLLRLPALLLNRTGGVEALTGELECRLTAPPGSTSIFSCAVDRELLDRAMLVLPYTDPAIRAPAFALLDHAQRRLKVQLPPERRDALESAMPKRKAASART